MTLRNLTLTAFRSYVSQHYAFEGGLMAFIGQNGAGKTNILEALSLFGTGRGLRSATLSEFQNIYTARPWALSLQMKDGTQLGTGRDPQSEDTKRRIAMIEGSRCSPQAFHDYLSITWLTPAMDRLWVESPGTRRRFLDRLVTAQDPCHNTRINRYEEALAERNRLLKENIMNDAWLSGLEHILATEGIAIAAARWALVKDLQQRMKESHGDFPVPDLALEGVETWLENTPALIAEDRLRSALKHQRQMDTTTGSTSLGPHRSDMLAWHREKNMPAAFCSTGEQKALLISITLAHAACVRERRHGQQILLLDEIGAHLDEIRRIALFEALENLSCQVFMTGTDSSLFTPLKPQIMCYHLGDEANRPAWNAFAESYY